MYKYIITPLLLCCLASSAAADDVQLQPNHPERYVVVKGDTLWGISGKFLKDPWKWPEVWKMNREQIKNPHLIYPGDVVVLNTTGNGEPQLSLLRETVTLQPGIVVEPLEKEAVPAISPNIIEPFLSRPLIIEKNALESAPTIIAGPDNRVALSAGTRVYIDNVEEGDGLRWHVYRPNKALVDPETKELLGVEALYLGDAKISKYGEPATATITRAKEEIFVQDKLVAAADNLQSSFIPHAPETDITGRVMTIYGGVAEAGAKTIISINKGALDGLEQGHVLSINRAGEWVSRDPKNKRTEEKFPMQEFKFKDVDPLEAKAAEIEQDNRENDEPEAKAAENPDMIKLPDERIGLLMVFRTFDRVSYALIMQASEPVNVLDTVKTP